MSKCNDAMRRDWDERARRNPFLYIASWRKDWDERSFFESGEQDYLRVVDPPLQKLHFDPTGKAMAELGCGAGRMTRSFAQRFQSVSALDISGEMQSRGKSYLSSFSNIQWLLTSGETLSGVDDCSVDFVFSYLVLQHMPTKELVFAAVREMMRILRRDGVFLFQYNGSARPTMNWKGRALSGALDGLANLGLHSVSRWLARLAGVDSEMIGRTWRGANLTTDEISSALGSSAASSHSFLDAGTPMAWCYGRKQPVTGA